MTRTCNIPPPPLPHRPPQLPFLNFPINYVWVGALCGITYTAVLLTVLSWKDAAAGGLARDMTLVRGGLARRGPRHDTMTMGFRIWGLGAGWQGLA